MKFIPALRANSPDPQAERLRPRCISAVRTGVLAQGQKPRGSGHRRRRRPHSAVDRIQVQHSERKNEAY